MNAIRGGGNQPRIPNKQADRFENPSNEEEFFRVTEERGDRLALKRIGSSETTSVKKADLPDLTLGDHVHKSQLEGKKQFWHVPPIPSRKEERDR